MNRNATITAELAVDTFTVRQQCTLHLTIRADSPLASGDSMEVQFPVSWLASYAPSFTKELQTSDPAGAHYVAVQSKDGDAAFDVEIFRRQPWYQEGETRHGRCIRATLATGSVPANTPITVRFENTQAAYLAERETIWLRVNGVAPIREPQLVTTAGPAKTMRLIAPTSVQPGRSFDVLIVSLDRYDNCSSTRYAGKRLATTDGAIVAEGLAFTGSMRVPATLAAEGVYRFVMDDYVSNAVKVSTNAGAPYWGDIHVHTKRSSDGIGTEPYAYAREVSGLDFAATADHWSSLGPPGYEQNVRWAEQANRPGEFVTLFADERNPKGLMGHHNVYFETREEFERFAWYTYDPEKVPGYERRFYEELPQLSPDSAMVVPHHTGISFGRGSAAIDAGAFGRSGLPERMRPVMEVFSMHGQSERYAPGEPLSYERHRNTELEGRVNRSVPGPHYAQDYWKQGYKLGVIGSSDCHSGQPGRSFSGIAGVMATALTRDAVFQAIRARRCYATTGERILVEFQVAGTSMGQTMTARAGDKLAIAVTVYGTTPLTSVEVLRYRFGVDHGFVPIITEKGSGSLDASFSAEDEFAGRCMYYARIFQQPYPGIPQEDNEHYPGAAWSSPIWVEQA